MSRVLVIGGFGFLAWLTRASAQSAPGAIRGRVTDPAGASVPGAVVSANNGHGISRSASTDVRGQYVLANLPVGAFTVRVSAKGCAPAEKVGVTVASGAI